MKYFLDTEFIEGFKKPIKWLPTIGNFNKPYHSIQLISIGIVCEDGQEYYAISNEFNPADANKWVKENVLSKLPEKSFNGHNAQSAKLYRSNKTISCEIMRFVQGCEYPMAVSPTQKSFASLGKVNPQFYAYYADYDWVVFCSLFGTMMDLPKGFPMYCRDLKQMMDEIAQSRIVADQTFEDQLNTLKAFGPKQANEHNALADAKWNFELYKFLKTLNA